ncbi:dihydrofolate reductase family protein [Actinomadura opuntiae]|uniref:dihydrofolate reductase family protein n=1 Tax=Actinomadura sp. OS1-43 TaxID=604315 RepID=UPI00255A9659|nr:dihydrofolate reductase family protein [Actinomadura sp. OS1-43]MDL4814386.1 dihydrofolate reductase family protein [Actinomadura sp. OS1-43]
MGKVITSAAMSLDGFIAGPDETGFEHLFAWHATGDVEIPSRDPRWSFRVTSASAPAIHAMLDVGALVVGRRLFDLTQGWGGGHPLGAPVFVVTHRAPDDWAHPDAPFTFVTDGVESAVRQAREAADGKDVGVAAGDLARQALDAGLVDEIWVDLVPVLLGSGTRFVDGLGEAPVVLENPEVLQGDRVTHLRYRLKK